MGLTCSVCGGSGQLPRPTVTEELFERAWRIPTNDGTDYGVLVELAHGEHRHWYLICPATATLYLAESDGTFDLTDCCDGEGCDFLDDTHAKAHLLVQRLESKR